MQKLVTIVILFCLTYFTLPNPIAFAEEKKAEDQPIVCGSLVDNYGVFLEENGKTPNLYICPNARKQIQANQMKASESLKQLKPSCDLYANISHAMLQKAFAKAKSDVMSVFQSNPKFEPVFKSLKAAYEDVSVDPRKYNKHHVFMVLGKALIPVTDGYRLARAADQTKDLDTAFGSSVMNTIRTKMEKEISKNINIKDLEKWLGRKSNGKYAYGKCPTNVKDRVDETLNNTSIFQQFKKNGISAVAPMTLVKSVLEGYLSPLLGGRQLSSTTNTLNKASTQFGPGHTIAKFDPAKGEAFNKYSHLQPMKKAEAPLQQETKTSPL